MTRREWVRLDNASNIFLAARTASDPKVFRISAELDHDVDPGLLQEALDVTFDRYRIYHVVLRRGVFWYYLQDSDLRPVVTADEHHTCAPIYQADRRNLLFRVMHHRRRVVLEIFHALSDGTGALWFLTDLVTEYVRLRWPAAEVPPRDTGEAHALTTDSFAHYFRGGRGGDPTGAPPSAARDRTHRRPWVRKVFRVRGTRTPDHRTRVVELTMPADEVLALARAEGVSLTMYLTALFFEAIRLSTDVSKISGRGRTMAASVPVNLRQFFPSTSPRNFFAAVRVTHTYGVGPDDLGSICRQLEGQFRPKASRGALERKLRRRIRFERMPVLRIVPRPLKDLLLGLINRGSNHGLTIAVSNLGRISLPEPADTHVGRMLFHVSAARPQFCVMSHAGLLTISFTSPFTETDHIREFARLLTSRDVEVTVAAARVTEEELAEADLVGFEP